MWQKEGKRSNVSLAIHSLDQVSAFKKDLLLFLRVQLTLRRSWK
jgi:hypothetical protein